MTIEVRPASPEDLPALMRLGKAMAREAPAYEGRRMDEGRLRATLEQFLGSGGIFVADTGYSLVGCAMGYCVPSWWADDWEAGEFAVYVVPGRRGSAVGVRLVRALERWASEQGASTMSLGISTGIDPERTGRLYERLGYEWASSSYSRRLP